MQVERLSRHFVDRWRERVGVTPTLYGINEMLSSSQQIRFQRKLYKPHKFHGLLPWKLLAEFWNAKAGIIIRIDQDTQTAVTVITAGGSHV